MKIVNLDAYTTNPGDLSWEGIKKLGDLTNMTERLQSK